MGVVLMVHVVAGTIAVLSGAVALFAVKGSRIHRAGGAAFLISMLVSALAGAGVALAMPERITALAGFFTAYLVVTAWSTARQQTAVLGPLDLGMLLTALVIGAGGMLFGVEALTGDTGLVDGYSAEPYLVFGGLALFAAVLDVSVLIRGGIAGAQRIARHLWRMCFAFFIAAGSLFTGPGATAFPETWRDSPLLSAPELIILLAMIFWLVRVLFTRWNERREGM